MYASNDLEKGFLNIFKGQNLNPLTKTPQGEVDIFVSLYEDDPKDDNTGIEINYTGYRRQRIKFGLPTITGNKVEIKNENDITFPETSQSAGIAKFFGIHTSEARGSGTLLAYSPLIEPLVINAGESPSVSINEELFFLEQQLSIAYKKKLLNYFRGESISGFVPFLSFWSGSPDGAGAELTGGNYARIPLLDLSSPSEVANGQMQIQNTALVVSNKATGTQGDYTHRVIYDAEANGLPVFIQERGATLTVKKGFVIKYDIGNIKIGLN